MSRQCHVCTHRRRAEIDAELCRGASNKGLARQYGLSEASVRRHRAAHLPETLAMAQQAAGIKEAGDLLAEVRSLYERTLTILDQAERAKDRQIALRAIGEARANVELMAKMTLAAAEHEQKRIDRAQQDLSHFTDEELEQAFVDELLGEGGPLPECLVKALGDRGYIVSPPPVNVLADYLTEPEKRRDQ